MVYKTPELRIQTDIVRVYRKEERNNEIQTAQSYKRKVFILKRFFYFFCHMDIFITQQE